MPDKNCACRKNAALGPHLKHGTHDAPASTGTFELQSIFMNLVPSFRVLMVNPVRVRNWVVCAMVRVEVLLVDQSGII
jgi:hypothetical protein